MVFTKRLREGVRRGRIKCSVRVWTRPHVKVGGRYPMDEGQIVVDSITPIRLRDITNELARESGFLNVKDLLETAKHGRGKNVYRFGSITSRQARGMSLALNRTPNLDRERARSCFVVFAAVHCRDWPMTITRDQGGTRQMHRGRLIAATRPRSGRRLRADAAAYRIPGA